ncbi:carbohydrate kinase family protein [bacterium]|nr:carbohydrate kinase family protein [bacterium]NCQ54994.1 carbohydrate kinase family protein [Candidatus Parcubacteria bacterium]NCS67038.1 carbohydrate kinase family protein [Candidatus Peregrinibacteria bacterium]NCS95984.1 carbohydrate kinase family protein [bacterium]
MKKFDILCFGSLTLDIFIPLSEEGPIGIENTLDSPESFLKIPLGEKIQVKHSLVQAGGGASNTAVGFAKLGLKPAVFGVIGDQSYRGFMMAELALHNINTDYLTVAKNQTSSFSIILNSWEGERTVLHRRTACENFNEDTLLNAPATKALYFGHIGAKNLLEAIPAYKTKNKEAFIAWNPGSTQFKLGFDYFKPVFPEIDCLFINREEAEAFTGLKAKIHRFVDYSPELFGKEVTPYTAYKPRHLADLRLIANQFLNAGVKTVVITDGRRGAQVFTDSAHLISLPQEVPVLDTLGAGDSFAVGFVAAALHGEDLATQMAWGSFNAASVIQKFGAQPGQLKLAEIETLTRSLE